MKIINKVENELFGELFCFADENGNALFWGKQSKMKFLSKEEQNVIIGLDLYCFNKEFSAEGWKDDKVEVIVNSINKQYQIFLNDCNNMESSFIKEFNEEKEDWDIEAIIETKEDLYSKIQLIRIDIIKEYYIINFLLDGEEWSLIKAYPEDRPSYFSIAPRAEAMFAKMDNI